MIGNLKICCCNKVIPNRNFFLQIRNNGELNIQVILQYSIYGGIATKDSGILTTGQSARLCFQSNSTDIYFNIINESLPDKPLIYHGAIPVPQNVCYRIMGTVQNPICTNVPC